jgi:hypothetical protein
MGPRQLLEIIPLPLIPLSVPGLGLATKKRQRNVRQRNNPRICLFSIPLPKIPLPVLPFSGAACRAVPLRETSGLERSRRGAEGAEKIQVFNIHGAIMSQLPKNKNLR